MTVVVMLSNGVVNLASKRGSSSLNPNVYVRVDCGLFILGSESNCPDKAGTVVGAVGNVINKLYSRDNPGGPSTP
jgi:hypothetical protein